MGEYDDVFSRLQKVYFEDSSLQRLLVDSFERKGDVTEALAALKVVILEPTFMTNGRSGLTGKEVPLINE